MQVCHRCSRNENENVYSSGFRYFKWGFYTFAYLIALDLIYCRQEYITAEPMILGITCYRTENDFSTYFVK